MTRHLSHLKIEAVFDDVRPAAVEVDIEVNNKPVLNEWVDHTALSEVLKAVLTPREIAANQNEPNRLRHNIRNLKRLVGRMSVPKGAGLIASSSFIIEQYFVAQEGLSWMTTLS